MTSKHRVERTQTSKNTDGNLVLTEKSESCYCITQKRQKVESIGHIMCHFLFMKLDDNRRFYFHFHPKDDKDSLYTLRQILRSRRIRCGRIYNFYQANAYNLLTYELGCNYAQERREENKELASLFSEFGILMITVPFINKAALRYSVELPEDTNEHADKFNVIVKNDVIIIVNTSSGEEVERFDLSSFD